MSVGKDYRTVFLKSLKNLQEIGLLIISGNVIFLLISSTVSAHFVRLRIFCQLELIITRAFNMSSATRAVAFSMRKEFDRFEMLVFFVNVARMEFPVRYLA